MLRLLARIFYHLSGKRLVFLKSFYKLANGSRNKIIVIDVNGDQHVYSQNKFIKNLNVLFYGNNNTLYVNEVSKFERSRVIVYEDNCEIKFGKNVSGVWDIFCYKSGSSLSVGDNTTSCGVTISLHGDKWSIGSDCMFSNSIFLWTDGHAVLDVKTRECLNPPTRNMKIGNHVWVGERVSFTKNAQVPDDSIVAMASVVTKKFQDEHSLIAGNPASIRKRNITWDRKTPCDFFNDSL